MSSIGHWARSRMWVERKYVPKEDRARNFGKHLPGHRRCPFRDGRPVSSAFEREVAVEASMRGEMKFVCQRKSRAAPPPIAEIPSHPHRLDTAGQRGLQHEPEIL